MEKVTAYLSHAIRGAMRENATEELITQNCKEALIIAKTLRKHIPELDLWVPAEAEEFVHEAFQLGFLNEDNILTVDCSLLSKRNLLIVFIKNDLISNGMAIEINHAITKGISKISIHTDNSLQVCLTDIERLKKEVSRLLEKKNII